jgi:hypothetical protein
MAAANTTTNGYLTSTDWNTFNGKYSTGGALGTPSSGTLTNCTGLPVGGISATGTPSSTTYLRGDGTWSTVSAVGVTSVTGTAPVTVTTTLGVANVSLASGYGDTQNPYASKTANYFLAAPNGSSGTPSFRAIVAADIPTLNQNTTGTASNVTGTVAVSNGGTGATSLTANNVLLGNGTSALQVVAPSTSGNVLTSNGTTWTSSTPSAIGVGQTWTDVTASRAIGTTYTNSTGKPIFVSVTCNYSSGTQGAGYGISISIGGTVFIKRSTGDYYNSTSLSVNGAYGADFIVPAGATYAVNNLVTTSAIIIWSELR